MVHAQLPSDCRALIVEPEPMQALALDCLLAELGMRRMGPVRSLSELKVLVAKQQPSVALVDAEMKEDLVPIAEYLERHDVPFAFLAIGAVNEWLGGLESLRNRPRVRRPFHGPTLEATVGALYRERLRRQISHLDRHLAGGRGRLGRQIRMMEQLDSAGHDTAMADSLAREYGRLLRTARGWRCFLAARLEALSVQTTAAHAVGVAVGEHRARTGLADG